jgi:non-ribosomal peptide synthetase component F
MALLAALMLTIRRHCADDLVAVPVTVSGRERPALRRAVGWLSQHHLVAVNFAGRPTHRACLSLVRDAMLTADDEQLLSVSQYTHLAGLPGSAAPFRIGLNHLPDADPPHTIGGATITVLPRPFADTSLPRDVVLYAQQRTRSLRLVFAYAEGIVHDDGINAFADDLTGLLADLAARPDEPIDAIPGDGR